MALKDIEGVSITDEPDEMDRDKISYVSGLIYGDGNLNHIEKTGNYRVTLSNNNPTLIEEYVSLMDSLGFNTNTRIQEYDNKNHKDTLHVFCDSKSLYEFLVFVCKSPSNVDEILETDNNKRLFVRGFYEAEGSFEWDSYRIRISQKEQKILELVSKYINEIPCIETRWEHYGPYTNLVVGGRKRMKRFINWTDPCIKRRYKDG